MSSREALLGLRQSLSVLSGAIGAVQHSISTVLGEPAQGDWVLVADGFRPLPSVQLEHIETLYRYRGVEDGPPELPEELSAIASETLRGDPLYFERRASEAAEIGFWLRAALDTVTPYRQEQDRVPFVAKHWIVLSRRGPEFHRRLTSEALNQEEDPCWESFNSLCELTLCCVGARIDLPPLQRWISRQ